jgi:hypothetical protein
MQVVIRTHTGYRTEALADYEDRTRRQNQVSALRQAGAVPVEPSSDEAQGSPVVWVLPRGGAQP